MLKIWQLGNRRFCHIHHSSPPSLLITPSWKNQPDQYCAVFSYKVWLISHFIKGKGMINVVDQCRIFEENCCRRVMSPVRLSRKMIWKGEEWHVFDKFLQTYLWGNWNPFISIELWVLDFSTDFVQTIFSSANCKFPDIILDLFWEILSY